MSGGTPMARQFATGALSALVSLDFIDGSVERVPVLTTGYG